MNALEKRIALSYEAKGWTVIHKGWPDFLIHREKEGKTEIQAVEVKPRNRTSLRPSQKAMVNILTKIMPVSLATEEEHDTLLDLLELLSSRKKKHTWEPIL